MATKIQSLKANDWQVKFTLMPRGTISVISLRLEFDPTDPRAAINAEIPLRATVNLVSSDTFNVTLEAVDSHQCFLLAWMWSKRNKPIQVRVGLTNWQNSWDGTEINVYQSLFYIERRSSRQANDA
jgi:hypothetical protein